MSVPAVPQPREIAELETPARAKDLYDKIETLAQYARRYGVDHAKQNEIAEAKLRTARKGGELLESTVGSGKHKQNSHDASFGRLPEGFTHSMSSRWQMLASIPEDHWEQTIAHAKATANDELTLDRMVRIGRELKLGGRSEKREKKARAAAKKHKRKAEIVVADVQTWNPGTVDAIVTDPPYVGDVIPLYRALRGFALRSLREGGALVVMTWQGILPDVIEALRHPGLPYRWTLSWRYASAENSTVDYSRRVFDRWKPILVYHKTAMPPDATMISDEITSEAPDKTHHEWGQSLEGFEQLVRAVAKPGELVCDPFLGGGTTALAALAQGRDFIGADIDAAGVAAAEKENPVISVVPEEFGVAFKVHGLPIAQGSKTPWGAESAKGLPSWRQDIAVVAGLAMDREPVSDPVTISADFTFPRPKHHYGTGRNAGILKSGAPIWANKKPDLDKLLRALGDAITGIVIRDDSQIVVTHAAKLYGTQPGVKVRIELAP